MVVVGVSEAEAARVLTLLMTGLYFAISVFSLLVATRERRRGSPTWAWALPGTMGIFLLIWSLFLFWRGGGVGQTDQACAGILMVATFVAFVSALAMIANVYEGAGAAAWFWAACFVGFSLAAAWCFRELV